MTLAILLCAVGHRAVARHRAGLPAGQSGARVAGTVLFAVHTVGVLGVVASCQAGIGPAKVLTPSAG